MINFLFEFLSFFLNSFYLKLGVLELGITFNVTAMLIKIVDRNDRVIYCTSWKLDRIMMAIYLRVNCQIIQKIYAPGVFNLTNIYSI